MQTGFGCALSTDAHVAGMRQATKLTKPATLRLLCLLLLCGACCSCCCAVQDLALGPLATSFALLRLPRMPEIKHGGRGLPGFTPSEVDPDTGRSAS